MTYSVLLSRTDPTAEKIRMIKYVRLLGKAIFPNRWHLIDAKRLMDLFTHENQMVHIEAISVDLVPSTQEYFPDILIFKFLTSPIDYLNPDFRVTRTTITYNVLLEDNR